MAGREFDEHENEAWMGLARSSGMGRASNHSKARCRRAGDIGLA
jgi:hypothetical protein